MNQTTYKPGETVYWIEFPSTVREGKVIRSTGNRYIIRRGYEQGVCLPENRLFPTYEAAAATLPQKTEEQRRTGHWHWWAG